jgi:hypothetical protein
MVLRPATHIAKRPGRPPAGLNSRRQCAFCDCDTVSANPKGFIGDMRRTNQPCLTDCLTMSHGKYHGVFHLDARMPFESHSFSTSFFAGNGDEPRSHPSTTKTNFSHQKSF